MKIYRAEIWPLSIISLSLIALIILAALYSDILAANVRFDPLDVIEEEGLVVIRGHIKPGERFSSIYYGRLKKNPIIARSIDILDLQGGYGRLRDDDDFVLIIDDGAGKIDLFPAFEADYFKYSDRPPAKNALWGSCWPFAQQRALLIGMENAGGFVYYDKGWKWAQCGD